MTSKVKIIWDLVKAETTRSGFRRVDIEHLLDFYAGVDSMGRYTLLLITRETPSVAIELHSVTIHTVFREDGRWSLLFILENPELLELFQLFCEDLISSSRQCSEQSKGLQFVLKRLVSWRMLFERGMVELLTESQVRGLTGELIHLKALINAFTAPTAIQSWKGPDRADQDFQLDNSAWEVKTIWPSVNEVTIASERQLDYTQRELQLVVVELGSGAENTANGFTLNQLVDGIRELLKSDFETYSSFENCLLRYGYSSRPEYENQVLVLHSISYYNLAENFPCIRPQDLFTGVNRVRYKLNLDNCIAFKI